MKYEIMTRSQVLVGETGGKSPFERYERRGQAINMDLKETVCQKVDIQHL